MKIDLTPKEYRNLLSLIYLGNWVMTCHDVEEDTSKSLYEEITQKIYSLAEDFGCQDLIEYDSEFKEYSETLKLEESEVNQYLEEFEENTFWETLITRLAQRDILNEMEPEEFEKLSVEERFQAIGRHEDKWAEEFSENGIENLNI